MLAACCENEFCARAGEYSHTVVVVVYEIVAQEYGYLYAVGGEVVFGRVYGCYGGGALFDKFEGVFGYPECGLGLQVEFLFCEPEEGVHGVAYLVAFDVVLVEPVAVDGEGGVVIGYCLKARFYSVVEQKSVAAFLRLYLRKWQQGYCYEGEEGSHSLAYGFFFTLHPKRPMNSPRWKYLPWA